MINNNFFYILNHKYNDYLIHFFDYLSLLSILNIQQPNYLFIYYHQHILNGNYYNSLKNNKWIFNKKAVQIHFIKYENKQQDKQYIISNELNKYGGVFLKNNYLLLRKINNFFIYDYLIKNNIIYGLSIKDNIDHLNKYEFEDKFIYSLDDLMHYEHIIFDYNFSLYFDIIYHHYFLELMDNITELNIESLFLDHKITIFNLIIYYIIGFYFYYDEIKLIDYSKLNLLNTIDSIYWLNLNTSIDRKNNMELLLNHIPIQNSRFEAFNGKEINNIREKYFQDNKIVTNNTNSEYAVLLSHLSLLNHIYKNDKKSQYILILEDDMSFDFIHYWKTSIHELIKNAPKDWEILMLGYFSLNPEFKDSYRLWNNDWSALSYIVNKNALTKLNSVIDQNNKFKLLDDVNVADNYIFRLFKTYVYQYPYFTIKNNNSSTFHKDHDLYQKIYKNLNYITLNNLLKKYFSNP